MGRIVGPDRPSVRPTARTGSYSRGGKFQPSSIELGAGTGQTDRRTGKTRNAAYRRPHNKQQWVNDDVMFRCWRHWCVVTLRQLVEGVACAGSARTWRKRSTTRTTSPITTLSPTMNEHGMQTPRPHHPGLVVSSRGGASMRALWPYLPPVQLTCPRPRCVHGTRTPHTTRTE